MTPMDWLVIGTTWVAASMLIVAGLDKLVAPGNLAVAIRDVVSRPVTNRMVRVAAVAEVLVGAGLTVSAVRVYAALGLGAFGLTFVVIGVAGWLRRSKQACGCLGRYGRHPLGPVNVACGLGFLVVSGANLGRPVELSATDLVVSSAYAVAVGSVALCLMLNRTLIQEFTKPAESS